MPAFSQRDDLEAASVELGQANGYLIAFAAGGEKHGLIEPRRGERCQFSGKVDDGRRDHAAEEVVKMPRVLGYRLNDLWVSMANQAGHLARSPVENAVASGRVDVGIVGMGDERGVERSVREQVGVGLLLEGSGAHIGVEGACAGVVLMSVGVVAVYLDGLSGLGSHCDVCKLVFQIFNSYAGNVWRTARRRATLPRREIHSHLFFRIVKRVWVARTPYT